MRGAILASSIALSGAAFFVWWKAMLAFEQARDLVALALFFLGLLAVHAAFRLVPGARLPR